MKIPASLWLNRQQNRIFFSPIHAMIFLYIKVITLNESLIFQKRLLVSVRLFMFLPYGVLPSLLQLVHFPDCVWLIIPEGGTWMGSWGWLMVSVWRGPIQSRLARLEPLFTQPLRPDWEALFSHPGAFQRKPPPEAPLPEVKQLKTIHSTSSSCCRAACLRCTLRIWKKINSRLYYRKITFFNGFIQSVGMITSILHLSF